MRLLVVSSEVPVPATHGGRVDQWSRYRLFRQDGVAMMLVSWFVDGADAPTAADEAALAGVFDDVHLFPIRRDAAAMLRRLADLPHHSPHVSTRILRGAAHRDVLAAAKRFEPDAVWLDGLHGAVTARALAAALGVPLFYRSHNVEFLYRRTQAQRATRLRDRIAWRLAGFRLEALEVAVQRKANLVFDISADDLAYWRSRGITHNRWLPTLLAAPPSTSGPKTWDLVYLGNLNTPNNLEGLRWFLHEVLPRLRDARPDITLRIAGSQPDARFRQEAAASGIDLRENPPDAHAVLAEGRVLFNPVLAGSGLNVKSVEMLFHDAPVVSTPAGVRGLPDDIRAEFHIAAAPEDFARRCLEQLARPFVITEARRHARLRLGPEGIGAAIDAMRTSLRAGR
ncbi:MAG: glycosyltransferase [Rhizobiales bacterium]|nr:glycosyltransferase [Hyphomicrobiales bacterium]